jgi:hypothetical protein
MNPDAALVLFSGGQDNATRPACELRARGWQRYSEVRA